MGIRFNDMLEGPPAGKIENYSNEPKCDCINKVGHVDAYRNLLVTKGGLGALPQKILKTSSSNGAF